MSATLMAMMDKRRKHLEDELVRVAQELAECTNCGAYIVPYKRPEDRGFHTRFIAVGSVNSIMGLLTQANQDVVKGKFR
jgi:ribosomal protein L32